MRCLVPVLLVLAVPLPVIGQPAAPNYEECRLLSVFPAGGRRGETVEVEFTGAPKRGLEGTRAVLIDGPPGITARAVKNVSPTVVKATLAIAPDAAPGRRCVRLVADRCGLTNMLYFTVGRLPEVIEREPNNDPAAAQSVSLPVVVNGRIDPKADQDCFAFQLRKGQRLTAAVLAHALDSHGQGRNYGVVDATLELLDDRGRVVAEAGDTLGLDPLVEFTAPADGRYTARVRLEGYEGFPQAVYRLVLGEVALATSVFPPGGRRGEMVEVELDGPGIGPTTRTRVRVPADDPFPLQFVRPAGDRAADLELPFVRGDWPERVEAEPNDRPDQATSLSLPMTVNGRFDRPADADWYRLRLAAGQTVRLETTAQRFLRAPVDTLLEVYDAAGTKKLAENDDGFPIDYVSIHDYRPMDSRLVFKAPAAGDYLVRVTDESGGGGPRSVYRLTAVPAEPDFELFLTPDGVPVWGPGTTAALLVKADRSNGYDGEIELRVEGLPPGWIGSESVSLGKAAGVQAPFPYHFLTITAPSGAKVGDVVPFRVVGRAKDGQRAFERVAQPITLYYTSDTGFFRVTPQARAAVAAPQAPWLTTTVRSVTAAPGGMVEVPVEVHGLGKFDALELSADMGMGGVATALAAPKSVPVRDGRAAFSVKLPDSLLPGRSGFTVGLRWRSDIRIGMPGPCTPLIALDVLPPKPQK